MGAAVALGNVVGEAQHALVVAVVPPHCDFNADAVLLRAHHDGARHHGLLVAVEVFDELFDAALVEQLLTLLDRVAHVGEHDVDAGIQKRQLAQAMFQRREIILDIGEGLGRGEERHFRSALAVGIADDFQRRDGIAVLELDVVFLAVAPDPQFQLARQRVDHGDAYAVQSAGHLVGVLVEFAAGMELGHDDFSGRNAFALVNVGRDTAAVVAHSD